MEGKSTEAPPVAVTITKKVEAVKKSADPPLLLFQLTNPITYIKKWWTKLIGNEGVKVTIQVKPVTAFVLTCVVTGIGFGAGRLSLPDPIIKYIPIFPSPIPSPSPNPFKETAFTGKVQFSGGRYFLVTSSAEAIKLETSNLIDLSKLVGKRLLVAGLYDKSSKIMQVMDISNLEILVASPIPIPTIKPSPTPNNAP